MGLCFFRLIVNKAVNFAENMLYYTYVKIYYSAMLKEGSFYALFE